MSEQQIQNDIREALGREPDVCLWRNNVGAPETLDGRRHHYGLPRGSADLVGILGPQGRLFCLEVKAPRGRLQPHQAAWLDVVRRFGGFAAVVRSVDDALAAVARARAGARE